MMSQAMAAPQGGATTTTPQAAVEPPAEASASQEATPRDADRITENLRSLFRTVENEALPERLQRLLTKLAEEEGRK